MEGQWREEGRGGHARDGRCSCLLVGNEVFDYDRQSKDQTSNDDDDRVSGGGQLAVERETMKEALVRSRSVVLRICSCRGHCRRLWKRECREAMLRDSARHLCDLSG